jgi:hypothetical protein
MDPDQDGFTIRGDWAAPAPHEAATFQAISIGSTICMPLVKEGRLTALMAIHHKDPHVWSTDELDDRFHETGIDGTGSMLVDSSFETERGVVSWQDGVRRSSWR